MKFTKMSLVAALLIGSSAFAIENTKVTGDANVYYQTQDKANSGLAKGDGGFFEAQNSAADIALNLNVTTDLLKNDSIAISAGAGYTVLTTLGLENNLVGNVWGGAHTAAAGTVDGGIAKDGTGATYGEAANGAKVNNANWVNEAWVAATAGKTTVKVGRMELDTPLAFTETWSIEKNTFEAAVLVNQDIPDTTLVAAFVGNGNGTENFGYTAATTTPAAPAVNPLANAQSNVQALSLAAGPVVNGNGDFTTYGTNGAYAIGAVNNSWKPLTAQAWYYDVTRLATAYWVQADLAMSGVLVGGQYTGVTADAAGAKENVAAAAMIGYTMKDTFTAKIAYSQASTSGSIGYAGMNTATATGTAQSKLYTEAWWNYGQVTMAGSKAVNLTVEAPTSVADLGLFITSVNQKATDSDLLEATLTASTSIGALDATVAYIYTDAQKNNSVANKDVNGDARATNTVQAYLTLNF